MNTAKDITQQLYELYGSDSGYLFGIEPKHRDAVELIVKISMNIQNNNKEEKKSILDQYKCRKCGRFFYVDENKRTEYDLDFGCPYGCDDNGMFIKKKY